MISLSSKSTSSNRIFDALVRVSNFFQSNSSLTLAILAASLIPYGSLFKTDDTTPPECILVVDSGFSFTHVVPLMNGNVIWKSVRR